MSANTIHNSTLRYRNKENLVPSSTMGSSDRLPSPSPSSGSSRRDESTQPSVVKNTPQWLTFAIGSGAFAAFNGVFAKLTTTAQTQVLASSISHALGFGSDNSVVELVVRAMFFALNLLSNAIMWILFTRALTASTSTTRVAIMNTSANFLVTAILGMVVFSEGLPLTWWLGAALLVAGTVVIGARESKEQQSEGVNGVTNGVAEDASTIGMGVGGVGQSVLIEEGYRDRDDEETLWQLKNNSERADLNGTTSSER